MAVRIGGQAVIEGVMMKNMDRYAVSVRKPNGKIETKVEECVSFAEKHPLFQLPVFRGMVNFLESMVIGMKTLNYSASFYEDEEEQTESRTEQLLEKILGEKAEKIIMGIVLVFSLAISIGLFMILPYIASEALGKLIRNEYVILFMEGIIRVAIFLGYIVLISRMEDIKRVFMYHGAEHKTINCLEAGVPLTPENAPAPHSNPYYVQEYSQSHRPLPGAHGRKQSLLSSPPWKNSSLSPEGRKLLHQYKRRLLRKSLRSLTLPDCWPVLIIPDSASYSLLLDTDRRPVPDRYDGCLQSFVMFDQIEILSHSTVNGSITAFHGKP